MRVIVCDETGLVKRVDFGESPEKQAAVVRNRAQHRPTAPLVASFDRHTRIDEDGAGEGPAHPESAVLLGLADGSVERLDFVTGVRAAVLPAGTCATPIVSSAHHMLLNARTMNALLRLDAGAPMSTVFKTNGK